jgi:hypothetical protein
MPAWLLASMPVIAGWLSNRAVVVVMSTAAIALMIAFATRILVFISASHVMPPLVYQVLTVVAPADWVAQVSMMVGIKSLSMAYRSSMYMLEKIR